MRSAKLQIQLDPQLPLAKARAAGTQTARAPQSWSNPVVPGDHPDPTIIRVGNTYWASATSGEWSPQFPIFRSADLVHWQPAGSLFPVQPAWAEGSFWAPELVYDEVTGRTLAWYVARKRGGPLSIAVATADSPGGPYTDHGPLVSEADGSIDPCFARDEHGQPYLIWKEDGNSAGRPTPIWAQALSDDLLTLHGPKTQLITDDSPWEEGVVEGPYILRHREPTSGKLRFYLFYAGNSCCGRECKYAEGVARADKLLGPWEKHPGNPIVGANDSWRCPGHGTAVRTSEHRGQPAQDYLLYHAYPANGTIYVGREAVMDEITWSAPEADGAPGWPVINAGRGPGANSKEINAPPTIDFRDDFAAAELGQAWQWPVNTHPQSTTGAQGLTLTIPAHSDWSSRPVESALLAVPRPASLHYRVTVTLTQQPGADDALWAGLSVVGDPFNTIGLGLRGGNLVLWQRRGNSQKELWRQPVPTATHVKLQVNSTAPEHHVQFAYSTDGEHWQNAGEAVDASDLPAWDRGLRLGLMLEGPQGRAATFGSFELCAL